MKHLSWIFLLAITLLSCMGETEQDDWQKTGQEDESEALTSETSINAFSLMQNACFSCHSIDPNGDSSAGPTFQLVKQTYLQVHDDQTSFVSEMSDFILEPKEEKALLRESVQKYGIMPNMGFDQDQAEAIATYLYEQAIEKDSWFKEQYPLEQAKYAQDPSEMSYLDRGFHFAMATKSVLGKNLKGKIKSEGTDGALDFCNLQAIHLTDSMANELGVSIKRVSDKNRNPDNAANDEQLAVIEDFKQQLAENGQIQGTTKELEDAVLGYYPIVTNQMCLQCHGGENDIRSSTADLIAERYPLDKATGYGENELRGIWVIKMKK